MKEILSFFFRSKKQTYTTCPVIINLKNKNKGCVAYIYNLFYPKNLKYGRKNIIFNENFVEINNKRVNVFKGYLKNDF